MISDQAARTPLVFSHRFHALHRIAREMRPDHRVAHELVRPACMRDAGAAVDVQVERGDALDHVASRSS